MPFIPLSQANATAASFPRVSAGEQALRDADAEQIVGSEFDQTMPEENRAALEREYAQRFGKEPPAVQRGFVPLASAAEPPPARAPRRGFVPLGPETPSGDGRTAMQRLAIAAEPVVVPALRTAAAMGNPVAVAETAGNLLTQIPAFAGYLVGGGATAAGRALGLTDRDPKEVGGAVADAMTYHPRTDAGRHLTETVLSPLTALNQGAEWAGHKVADATGSPGAGALTEATGQMLPAFVAPAAKGAKAIREKFRPPAAEPAAPTFTHIPGREGVAATDSGTEIGYRYSLVDADQLRGGPLDPNDVQVKRIAGDIKPQRLGESDTVTEGAPVIGNDGAVEAGGVRAQALQQAYAKGKANGYYDWLEQHADHFGFDPRQVAQMRAPVLVRLRTTPVDRGEFVRQAQEVPGAVVPELSMPEATRAGDSAPGRGFVPLEEIDGAQARVQRVAGDDPAVHRAEAAGVEMVRRQGDQGLPGVDGEFRSVPAGRWAGADAAPLVGPAAGDAGILSGELHLDDHGGAAAPAGVLPEGGYRRGFDDRGGSLAAGWPDEEHSAGAAGERRQSGDSGSHGLPPVALDHASGLDASVGRMGAAGRPGYERTVAEDRAGDAPRGGADTGALSEKLRGFVPLGDTIDAAAHEAATSPLNDRPHPTPAQIEAGNYKVGPVKLHGLDVAIENPAGSVRSGIDAAGKPWQTEMQHHYGYVRRTLGKDGDPVDVFIGPKPESQRVFVIDQVDPRTGRFDEHKAILGAESPEQARAIYQDNFEPGWRGAGAMTEMAMPQFKDWLADGDTRKPVGIKKLLGQPITEHTDAALARLQTSEKLTDAARAKVEDEIAWRKSRAEAASPETLNAWAPGANYVPLVDDARAGKAIAAGTADLPAPLRRERIISELAKGLGTTVYEGRVKGNKRLGFFRPKVEEVRIKRANDIEVAAHELAHMIDFRLPEIKKTWEADKALRDELKSVSYDQKDVREGWAEAMRLWMTQPDALAAKAPKAHAMLEKFADSHQFGPALRKAQADMTAWFGQDALNRARSKIGTEKPLAEYFDGFWGKFRQSVTDDLHGVYAMEREMSGGKVAPVGPYESARLTRASHSIADGAVRYGYPVKNADGSFRYAGKGLEEILRPVAGGIDDTLLYFVGKSARELQDQGREHLFSRAETDAMLRLRTPEREQAFKEYQAWNKGILDFAEAQGIINPEARRLWQRTQYLPFHRVGQAGGLKGKPGDWAGIKALTGGTENIRDVLGNMVGNAAMLIDKAVKNEARLKIADLASQKGKGGGRFMVKIDTESRPVKISGDQVINAMLKRYGIGIDGEAPAFFEFLIKGQPPAGHNVVAVLKGGKPEWYEVGDPLLLRSLEAIDRPPMHWLTKWLGLPKRIGQMSVTLTPDFMVANIARDTLMGGVMSRAGFRPVLDSLKGMAMRITKDQTYKDWVANGGGLSSIHLDTGKLRTSLEKFYRAQGIDYRTVLDTPSKMLDFAETVADAFEASTRLGEYKRTVDRGENPRHAAYLARDVSTDFAMKGDSKALGFLYDTVMFLRPAVVSLDRIFRGVAHDPNKGAIAVKTGLVALASMALYLLNRDDKRYQDMPDWLRDSHWIFFVGDKTFKMPKVWEVGAIGSLAERTLERTIEADPAGLGKDMARIIANVFSLNLMPQIIAPLAEQAANRNSFTGAKIETPGMENVQPFLRAKPGTSETMKAAGMATRDLPESLQINPTRAEALLRGYLNTWSLYGLALSDKAFFGDKLPAGRIDQLPVIRRFYEGDPARATKYESQFYDMLEEAKRLHGTLRELDHQGLKEIADEMEQSPMAGESKPLERAAKNLSGINKDMQAVRRDANLSPEDKRLRLDALTVERNAMLKAAVLDSKRAQRIEEAQRAEAKLKASPNFGEVV